MNRTSKNEKMLQYWVVVLLVIGVPALAWGQHKTSAPASHASAPAAPSAPSHARHLRIAHAIAWLNAVHTARPRATRRRPATAIPPAIRILRATQIRATGTRALAVRRRRLTEIRLPGMQTRWPYEYGQPRKYEAGHTNTAGHGNTAAHGTQRLTETRQPTETPLQAGAMLAERLPAGRSR